MRAFPLVTFGAITALFSLTACFDDSSVATDKVTSENDPPAASSSAAATGAPVIVVGHEFTASEKENHGEVAVSDSGADDDLDASDADICGSGEGTRDESQVASNDNTIISVSQSAGQTFTAVRGGILTGIELGLKSCSGVDPAANVVMTLSRGETVLARASISASSIPSGTCLGGAPLSYDEISAGFFDLSGDCVSIASGDHLSIALTVSGSTASCSGSSNQCIGGAHDGDECESDDDCQYAARLGIQSSDEYDAGAMFVNGSSTGWDSAFKTFVR